MDYSTRLEALGLEDIQIATILSGWRCDSIEALLRGELKPPSMEGIARAIAAFGAD